MIDFDTIYATRVESTMSMLGEKVSHLGLQCEIPRVGICGDCDRSMAFTVGNLARVFLGSRDVVENWALRRIK